MSKFSFHGYARNHRRVYVMDDFGNLVQIDRDTVNYFLQQLH